MYKKPLTGVPCSDCFIRSDGEAECTMNCGPCVPPVADSNISMTHISSKHTKKCGTPTRSSESNLRGVSNVSRTRNAEYLQICQALQDLNELRQWLDTMPLPDLDLKRINSLIFKADVVLTDRRIVVEPTGAKNRRSPK